MSVEIAALYGVSLSLLMPSVSSMLTAVVNLGWGRTNGDGVEMGAARMGVGQGWGGDWDEIHYRVILYYRDTLLQ